jgi:hypothetical protein
MKYIEIKQLTAIEVSDLDLVNEDEILGVNPEGHDCKEIVTKKLDARNHYIDESIDINIDTVIGVMKQLKEKGCNYVQIFHHSDHHAYEFYGIHMSEMTDQDQINDHLLKENESEKRFLKKRIAEMEEQIAQMKKRL